MFMPSLVFKIGRYANVSRFNVAEQSPSIALHFVGGRRRNHKVEA